MKRTFAPPQPLPVIPDELRLLQSQPRPHPITWIVTDSHTGQPNMEWDGRSYRHTEQTIMAIWRNVRRGDRLLHLGDVIYTRASLEYHQQALQLLVPPGVQGILTIGNHDQERRDVYEQAGLQVCDQVVIDGILFSHRGQVSIGTARAQVHGHTHLGPPHPNFERALRLSWRQENYQPLNFEALVLRLSRAGLLRPAARYEDDCWHLRAGPLVDRYELRQGGQFIERRPWREGEVPDMGFDWDLPRLSDLYR